MLSEFDINTDNPRAAESQWTVQKIELETLVNKARMMFSDKKFLAYVEKQLDYDREAGEW